MTVLNSKTLLIKVILTRIVKYIRFVVIFVVVASLGLLMGEQGLTQKQKLEEKLGILRKESDRLVREIKSLERRVTLLRSDSKTIEKVAKRRLGMARPDETVYVFQRDRGALVATPSVEPGLVKGDNLP
jgi:cell division protein FtsB